MKKPLLLLILCACWSAPCAFGQACINSKPLVCQLPLTSAYLTPFGASYSQDFLAQAEKISSSINAALGAQLTQLPVPSATVGTISILDNGSITPEAFNSLGPILIDRPGTVGIGHFYTGFSFQHFNFTAVDGVDLGNFPLALSVMSSQGPPGKLISLDLSVGNTNKVRMRINQSVGAVTYGINSKTDLFFVVPVNSVSISVTTSDIQGYEYFPSTGKYYNFDLPGLKASTTGSANGVGDITVGLKRLIVGLNSRLAVASGASVRFPSGDALNFLGSGAWGGNLYGLFEYRSRRGVAPHLKMGYQWNGDSQLMNIQKPPSIRLPGGLQYDAGADYSIVRTWTVAADVQGSQLSNTPTIAWASAPSAVSSRFSSLVPSNSSTFTTVGLSAGLKYSPKKHLSIYGNVLLQIRDVGLRSDPVPLFGIDYNFRTKRSPPE